MLVLTRSVGECIVIGDNITVRVLEANAKDVLLGINAPDDVSVRLKEAYAWTQAAPDEDNQK